MASRHLNTRAYQDKSMTDRTNGTLCSRPCLETATEVPTPSVVEKVKEVEAVAVKTPRTKKEKE